MAFNPGDTSGGGRRIGATLSEINIIPLVDVVLVLLLIFMLTAPMMYRGIDVNLPLLASPPRAHGRHLCRDMECRSAPRPLRRHRR